MRSRRKRRKKLGGNVTGIRGNGENAIHCGTQGRRRISKVAERLRMIRSKMTGTVRLLRLVQSNEASDRR